MKMNGKILSLIFTLIMLIPLGAIVYYNRMPEPVVLDTLILDDKILEVEFPYFVEENRVFLNVKVLDSLGLKYTVEATEGRLVLHIGSGAVAFEDDIITKQITSEAENVNFPLKALNSGWYIELERFGEWLGLNWTLAAEQKSLLLDSKGERIFGIVSKEGLEFYSEPNRNGKHYTDLKEGDKLRLFTENGDEYRIRTLDGRIGYGLKEAIIAYPEKNGAQENFIKVRNTPKQYGPLNITFEYVSKYSSNPNLAEESKIQGLDVLCPTWFSLNENSVVTNDGSIRYTRDAHKMGYRIWGVFRNGFEPEQTHQLLASKELRARAVADIAFYAAYYELDGINIDFENVYKKDKSALSDFLKQLDSSLTRQGVTLSVDAAPPWGSDQWSLFLDRASAARTADYIVLMAYDEHYASSDESGSVASLPWTEKAIAESLKLIPAEKLLLGVPLYTRVWSEKSDGAGGLSVSSKAIGMKDQEELLLGKDPDYLYDDKAGQMTASYKEDGVVKRIWIEDETSMKARLLLIKKYKLAGLGSWRRGFETEDFWSWVQKQMKGK